MAQDSRVSSIGPGRFLWPSVALSVVLFISVCVLAGNILSGRRLDLTQDRLYTLSDGTRQTLAQLSEPVRLRFYLSRALIDAAPQLGAYAERVRQLLDTYVALSAGQLRLDVIDPQPFSVEEDRAVASGLAGTAVNSAGDRGFFGLVGTNTTGDQQVIGAFTPDRESFLEYDLTRMLVALASPGRPVVAMIDGLGLAGSMANRFQPQQVMEQLRQTFEIRIMGGDLAEIPADVRVLLLVNPQTLSDQTLYAIDQFALRGGPILAFVDPLVETQTGQRPGEPPVDGSAALERLFTAWGVVFTNGQVVADRRLAMPVQANVGGRPTQTTYLPWLQIRPDNLAAGDAVTARLDSLLMTTAGAFSLAAGASTKMTPLIQSSMDAALIDKTRLAGSPDPAGLARGFKPEGGPFWLAVRVTGPASTAFPDGPPKPPAAEGAPPAELRPPPAGASLNLILVGDADMLTDRNWVDVRTVLGQRMGVPFAANADFALNALENLAGGSALISLRGRGLSQRPFETVRNIEAAADLRYREREQALTQDLKDMETRLQSLARPPAQGSSKGSEGQAILTPDQQREIERFRSAMLQTRGELRQVQRALREDIDRLRNWVTAVNVAAMPLLIISIALAGLMWRPRRRPVARP